MSVRLFFPLSNRIKGNNGSDLQRNYSITLLFWWGSSVLYCAVTRVPRTPSFRSLGIWWVTLTAGDSWGSHSPCSLRNSASRVVVEPY
eukprot:1172942-Prorocentrum_minimum.AAC.1